MLSKLFSHSHRLTFPALAALASFALCIFFAGFLTLPVLDRDEARFAQASKQMVQTGDYGDIRFQDEARHKKPIGIYWLQAGAVNVVQTITGGDLSQSIWVYRLPSLLGALLAVLLTALIGTRLFNARIGFVAGLFMASCLILNVEARMAKTDAMLLACILACQLVLAKAFMRAGYAHILKVKDILLFWVALGAGILIKGPIIFIPVLGTLLGLKIMKRPIGWAKALRPAFGIPLLLAIVLPWFVMITLKTDGGFFHESAGRDLFAKIWEGQNWGGAPPGFYVFAAGLTFWPASLPLFLALPWLWKNRAMPMLSFLIAWVLPGWIAYEIFLTKLLHYTLPFYPALAIAAAAWLLQKNNNPSPVPTPSKWALAVGIIWVGISIVLLLGPIALPVILEHQLQLHAMFLASLALAGALAGFLFMRREDQRVLAPIPLMGAAFLCMLVLFGFTLPSLKSVFLSPQIMAAIAPKEGCPNRQIFTAGYNEPSLVFLGGTHTQFIEDGGLVAKALIKDACAIGVVRDDRLASFRKESQNLKLAETVLQGFNYAHGKPNRLTLFQRD